ncbi:MAG: alanine dehydrogenase [Phycisphaerae bacterium]
MVIGVPKEIKTHEYRVSVVPSGVEELTRRGHQVVVETHAGQGSGLSDAEYADAGATIADARETVYAQADLIVKVKEPLPDEWKLIRSGQVMFTYLHLAADRKLTDGLLSTQCVGIAYETITDPQGRLPLLTPMSEVAGRMSIQEGAKFLERPMMGRGILLGGIPGVEPAKVVILGGGVVGTNAAKVAAGLGARVVILDVNLDRLRYLDDVMPDNVHTLFSTQMHIRAELAEADLLVGAVLIPGARCPVLVPKDYLKLMKPGSVIVDVGVDQGGCVESIHPTTHAEPTYIVDGVVHYGVANMPGAVGRTSTFGLTNATLPYLLNLADKGYQQACREDPGLAEGINVERGKLTNPAVAQAFELPFEPSSAAA